MITSRENALLAYRHKKPEWIPNKNTDYSIVRPAAFLDRYQGTEVGLDGFGVEWTYEPDAKAPMPTPGKILFEEIEEWRDKVKIPDLNAIDWEKQSKKDLAHVKPGNLISILSLNGPFERMHACMSMPNALCALIEDPEECYEFAGAVADYKISYLPIIQKYYHADVFNLMDDYGSSDRMFMSPELWREIFKPHLKRIVEATHDYGMIYQHHSCGYIEPIIDELVEIGVDAIDPLQVMNVNIREFKNKYNDRLTFCGWFDNQGVFDRIGVTDEECYNETLNRVSALASDGNYIAYPITISERYREPYTQALADFNKHYN